MNVASATNVGSDLFPDEVLATTAALLRAQLAVRAALAEQAVEPAGLDEGTADLLVRLAKSHHGSLRGVDIARQLMTNPARVSRLVDRAERAGLVERSVDPADRRAQQVTLTAHGWETAQVYAPAMVATLRAIGGALTENERSTIVVLLDKLAESAVETRGLP